LQVVIDVEAHKFFVRFQAERWFVFFCWGLGGQIRYQESRAGTPYFYSSIERLF